MDTWSTTCPSATTSAHNSYRAIAAQKEEPMDHTTNIVGEISKSKIIRALRHAGHNVECPVTGSTLLNGVDVTSALDATQHDEWTLAEATEHLLDASGE